MRQSSALLLLLAWVLSHAGLSHSASTPKGSSSSSTLTSTLSTVDSQRHQRGLKKSGKGGKGGKGGGKSGGKGKGKGKGKKKKKKIKKQKGVHRIYRPIPRTLDGGKGGATFPDDHSLYGTVVDPSAANELPVVVVSNGGYHNHVPQQPETPPPPTVVGGDGYHHGYHHTHGHGGKGGGYYGGHSHGGYYHSHGGYYGGYYHSHGGGNDGHSNYDSSGPAPSTDDDGVGKGGGAGTFRCTVPGSTDYPSYPWCPPGVGPVVDTSSDDDDYYNNDDDGTSTAPSYDGVQNYVVDFALIIDSDVNATLARIEAYLNDDLAGFLAGHHSTKPYTGTYSIARADFFVSQDTTSSTSCLFC
jgi:hypothetical protein